MPDLGPLAPQDTYPYLLQVDGGLTGTPAAVEDGNGTGCPLSLSTTGVRVAGGLQLYAGPEVLTLSPAPGLAETYDLLFPAAAPTASGQVLVATGSGTPAATAWGAPAGANPGAPTAGSGVAYGAAGFLLYDPGLTPDGGGGLAALSVSASGFLSAGEYRVTSADATNPTGGGVAGRFPVYDGAGTLLGYVPIYS